jgi:hypothetical protein
MKNISCWRERATSRKKRTRQLWRKSLWSRSKQTASTRRHVKRAERLCRALAELAPAAACAYCLREFSDISLGELRRDIMRAIYIGRANVNKSSPI